MAFTEYLFSPDSMWSEVELYDLYLSRRLCVIKYSLATSRVSWLRVEKNQRFEDHLCPRLQGTDVPGESVSVIYRPVSHGRGTRTDLYLTLTDSPDTSVP
jgi:hypothetical protein